MNEYMLWVLAIILIVTLVSLIPIFYSDWDLKRQISGKKKTRTYKGKHFYPGKEEPESTDIQIMKEELRLRKQGRSMRWR